LRKDPRLIFIDLLFFVIWDLEQDSKYLKLMVSDASSVVVFEFVFGLVSRSQVVWERF